MTLPGPVPQELALERSHRFDSLGASPGNILTMTRITSILADRIGGCHAVASHRPNPSWSLFCLILGSAEGNHLRQQYPAGTTVSGGSTPTPPLYSHRHVSWSVQFPEPLLPL